MHNFRAGSAGYVIGATHAVASHDGSAVIREVSSARSVLRHCIGDYQAMRMLRTLIDERFHTEVNLRDDVAVVELAAQMVAASHLRLIGPTTQLQMTRSRSLAIGATPAAAAATPPSRPAQAAAHSAPSEAVESSFASDLDAALLAAMLRDAAQDGTPFCEECARAARAA